MILDNCFSGQVNPSSIGRDALRKKTKMTNPPAPKQIEANVLVVAAAMEEGQVVQTNLQAEGYAVEIVSSYEQAVRAVNHKIFELLFIHEKYLQDGTNNLVRLARSRWMATSIILLCERRLAEIDRLRLGAEEILQLPVQVDELATVVEKCAQKRAVVEVPEQPRILVVDDEPQILKLIANIIRNKYQVTTTLSPVEALRILAQQPHEILISDLVMEGLSGSEMIHAAKSVHPLIYVLLITGYASKDAAIQALRQGAYDFIEKPFLPGPLLRSIEQAWRSLRVEMENYALSMQLRQSKIENEKLRRLVTRDPLTGLFNHGYLHDLLNRELEHCKRDEHHLSLLYIDIDNFSAINDNLGHRAGDKLLQFLSRMLRRSPESADCPFQLEANEIVTRFGGDEFMAILPETSKREAIARAEKLREYIENFDSAASEVPNFTISIGLSCFPHDADERSALIDAATTALKVAKISGRNKLIAYDSHFSQAEKLANVADQTIERTLALDRVIEQQLMHYHYQPIVNCQQLQIFAYEALCRPDSPTFASTAELLHLAENTGRIERLGLVMRSLSTSVLADLPAQQRLFINLHPLELQPALVKWGERMGAICHRIVLEITESMALENYSSVQELFTTLKAMGFGIALDDMGAGYSSLNSLALLEPDFIKLDMTIIRGIHADSRSARLLRYLLDFSKGEGMEVIAEGIETEEEKQVVSDLGCYLLQGYYFARPAPPFCNLGARNGCNQR